MTKEQHAAVIEILRLERPSLVRHGDAIGADSDFHKIAQNLGIPIVIHPSTLIEQRAFSKGAIKEFAPLPPLERNRIIVDSSDFIIAAPGETHEVLRSGTWATIRYAKRRGKKLYIIYPNGSYDILGE
jgi:hypothetical protein